MQGAASPVPAGYIPGSQRGSTVARALAARHPITPPAAGTTHPIITPLACHPKQQPCALHTAGSALHPGPQRFTADTTVSPPRATGMTRTMGELGSHPGVSMTHAPGGLSPCPGQALCPAWPAPAGPPRAAPAGTITTSTLDATGSEQAACLPRPVDCQRRCNDAVRTPLNSKQLETRCREVA